MKNPNPFFPFLLLMLSAISITNATEYTIPISIKNNKKFTLEICFPTFDRCDNFDISLSESNISVFRSCKYQPSRSETSTTFENSGDEYYFTDLISFNAYSFPIDNIVIQEIDDNNPNMKGIIGLAPTSDFDKYNPPIIERLFSRVNQQKIFYINTYKNKLGVGDFPEEFYKSKSARLPYKHCKNLKKRSAYSCNIDSVYFKNPKTNKYIHYPIEKEVEGDIGANGCFISYRLMEILFENYFNEGIESRKCFTSKGDYTFGTCERSVIETANLGDITFIMNEYNIKVSLKDLFAFYRDDFYFLFAHVNDRDPWIFGYPIFKRYLVIFNNEREEIGFIDYNIVPLQNSRMLRSSNENDENIIREPGAKRGKLSYIGSDRKIGRNVITNIMQIVKDGNENKETQYESIDIIGIGDGSEDSGQHLNGFILDLQGEMNIMDVMTPIQIESTNDYELIINSDLVISTVGLWESGEGTDNNKEYDNTERGVQSIVNKNLIETISKKVYDNAPNTVGLIVTNQVDTMCHYARSVSPKLKILGGRGSVGVYSPNGNQVIQSELKFNSGEFDGGVVGYHHNLMFPGVNTIKITKNNVMKTGFPLLSNLESLTATNGKDNKVKDEKEQYDKIIKGLNSLGGRISNLQNRFLNADNASHESNLQFSALFRFIEAYCFDKEIISSLNVVIDNEEAADFYGVELYSEYNGPLEISKGGIHIKKVRILEREKQLLREIRDNFIADLNIIDGYVNK